MVGFNVVYTIEVDNTDQDSGDLVGTAFEGMIFADSATGSDPNARLMALLDELSGEWDTAEGDQVFGGATLRKNLIYWV